MKPALLIALSVLGIVSLAPAQGRSGDECAPTASMRIYSNAVISEETGDVNGFELSVKKANDSTVDSLLYVYEGAPNNNGIHLQGHISGDKLTIEGNWNEHLIEYPSKKEIVQTHFVTINGTLNSALFRGKITIKDTSTTKGLTEDETVRLKRVGHIWLCKRRTN
jgi:hypothetical protein